MGGICPLYNNLPILSASFYYALSLFLCFLFIFALMDKTYRIADFRALERPAVYADNYYFALSPLRDYPALCKGVMVNGLLFLFCLDGEVSLKVNDCSLTIVAGDLLVAPPNTMLDDIRPSSGGSAVLVGYSIDILVRMLTGNRTCDEGHPGLCAKAGHQQR